MEIYKEAIRIIETSDLDNLEIHKLVERDMNLSKLFWFKGDKVKYCEEEYLRIKDMISVSLLQDIYRKDVAHFVEKYFGVKLTTWQKLIFKNRKRCLNKD